MNFTSIQEYRRLRFSEEKNSYTTPQRTQPSDKHIKKVLKALREDDDKKAVRTRTPLKDRKICPTCLQNIPFKEKESDNQ